MVAGSGLACHFLSLGSSDCLVSQPSAGKHKGSLDSCVLSRAWSTCSDFSGRYGPWGCLFSCLLDKVALSLTVCLMPEYDCVPSRTQAPSAAPPAQIQGSADAAQAGTQEPPGVSGKVTGAKDPKPRDWNFSSPIQ